MAATLRLHGAMLQLPGCGCTITGDGTLQDPVRIVFCTQHQATPIDHRAAGLEPPFYENDAQQKIRVNMSRMPYGGIVHCNLSRTLSYDVLAEYLTKLREVLEGVAEDDTAMRKEATDLRADIHHGGKLLRRLLAAAGDES